MNMSAASLVYNRYSVVATVDGVSGYNPTGDVVEFAFQDQATYRATDVPTVWYPGIWETDYTPSTLYVAEILLGPGGTFTPVQGHKYWVWIKIIDSPEIPVLQVATLTVY